MEANEVEKIFENHRLVMDWHKITERPGTIRYTLETQIRYYNEYMFDWDWLSVKEVVSTSVPEKETLGYDYERDWLDKLLRVNTGEKPEEALSFVVEVEK